jgi:hypothetical protein
MARDHFTGAHDDFDLIDVPLMARQVGRCSERI